MIAVDSSVIIGWLNGFEHPASDRLSELLERGEAAISPVTMIEIASDPNLSSASRDILSAFAVLPVEEGYWERAGSLRAKLLSQGRRARLADSLIAQSCIDAGLALLTRDRDFLIFVELGSLDLCDPKPV